MNPARPPRLSKSRFLSGLQCHKRLYLDVHAPQLAAEVDAQRRNVLDVGKDVGETARRRFPGGALVTEDHRHASSALERTAALMADSTVPAVFEGAFRFEGTLIRADVLERVAHGGWRLIEVKAASRVKSVHLNDLAVQTYVLQGNGLNLSGVFLMHVNRRYTYPGGEVDLNELLTLTDLTDAIQERLIAVPARLEQMRGVLGADRAPDVEPGHHCHAPYGCPFWAHCTAAKSSRWIYYLPENKGVVRRLQRRGIATMDDVPSWVSLTPLQRRVRDHREWLSPQLGDVLQSIRYPVHHVDFETFMPAVPLYVGTRPYQAIPIQWSNHTETADGAWRHTSYLCVDQKDAREEIAVRVLESVGGEGSICVYSDAERSILRHLAEAVPSLRKDLLRLVDRLWDLLVVVQTHYYHPDFRGSYSMKSVLPALVPSLDYGDLEIRDGATASAMYHQMVFVETDWVERQRLAEALHAYCARDSLGMMELRRVLSQKVANSFVDRPSAPC